jgi:hypothetical protein
MNPVIERCKTEKNCLVLSENANKIGIVNGEY